MSARPPLTALVITYNEEANIARCLASLRWADEILVVDSGSTDKTREAAQKLGAKVLERPWQGYGQQKNWGSLQSRYDWVLSVDADEEISPELKAEIERFLGQQGENPRLWGASMPRRTFYLWRWILHGGWYPNVLTRLAHRKHARWTEAEVHEELQVDGGVEQLKADLLHYTFSDVGAQVIANVRYARLGTSVARRRGESGSLAKILMKPIGKFLETYLWKRGFLDGLPGFVISINAAHSIFMKYVGLRFEKDPDHRQ